MEVPSKNSPEQYSFKIQEIMEIPEKTDLSIRKDRNKDFIENVRYTPYCNLTSSSSLIDHIQEEIFDGRTEVILLKQEPARDCHKTDHSNRQVIELSDNDSKMALRRQFGEIVEREMNLQNNVADYKNMEILRKLPSDTVVIRQEVRASKEDSDYRELIETNSSGSSSTSSCMAAKVKRIPRAVRNKTRETVEVRRNPMRVSRKNIDKDFSWPKQRLLANSKREVYSNYESGKRMKLSTMPYMNTRSVTRKMYTVGATYQAPTKRDETEWKEWPVHGMHERPVYHPQAGLAVEYLGRYFTSLDGLSYCEIIDEPEIEVVAVDPHRDRPLSSVEIKPRGKAKVRSKLPSNFNNTWSTYFSVENKSFETCMHGSLHCVLGYCSQIMSPTYKQTVEEKRTKLTVPIVKKSFLESAKETTNVKNNATNFLENADKFAEEAKLVEAYTIAMAQNVQNKSIMNNTSDERVASALASSSTMYIPEEQQSIVETDGFKTTPQSGEMITMNLKRILQGAPNSSLILLRNSAARTSSEVCAATAQNMFNPANLEDASISDQGLIEMSSIYKNLVFADKPASNCEESPAKNNLFTLKKHITNRREYTIKKNFLENQLENKKSVQVTRKSHENRNAKDEIKVNRESNDGISITSSGKNRAWRTSETSEIAKILSEYNRSMSNNSTIHNQIYSSRNIKANLTSSSAKNLPNSLWQKDTAVEENRNFITDTSMDLDFSQGKWKRFHLTLEKAKDTEFSDSNQNTWNSSSTSLQNHKISLRDQQDLSTFKYIKKKPFETHKNLNGHGIVMTDAKFKELKLERSKDEAEASKTKSLQELLENTAILYCAASGVHQDDLSNYIDTLDTKQSIQWLENWNNSAV